MYMCRPVDERGVPKLHAPALPSCMCIYIYIYIYTYVSMYRERGRERERQGDTHMGTRKWWFMKWWLSNGSEMHTSKYVCEKLLQYLSPRHRPNIYSRRKQTCV